MRLSQAMLELLAVHHLSDIEVAELQQTFMMLDKNKDGVLSKEELASHLHALNLLHIDVEKLLKECDTDANRA